MFGMLKSQSASRDRNPRTSLVVSLICCMGADGGMDEDEIGHLVSVLGRDATREQLDSALAMSAPPRRGNS
ncbi:hypothetical protein [Dankookia sp. GCM10030260]|uniref:hypothetical protein n=1 Tax=Dankookia sp. GCM10030260 TaxID=3273390 RepID=UPI0036D32A31